MHPILVAEKTSCRTAKKSKAQQKSVENCAEICKEISSMFSYGRSDDIYRQVCYCEIGAKLDGTCPEMPLARFDLFKYGEGKNSNMKCYTSSM